MAAKSSEPRNKAEDFEYEKVASWLREQITSGVFAPSSILPSESELTEKFGVSRYTVQKALTALKAEGLITSQHRRGSFVRRRSDRPELTYTRAITHHPDHAPDGPGNGDGYADTDLEHTDSGGRARWSQVEDELTYRAEALPDVALDMTVPQYTNLFGCDRLYEDETGHRMSHRLYVPFSVAAHIQALEDNPFRLPGDLYNILSRAGHQLHFQEFVRVTMPTADDSHALNVRTNTPLLVTVRITSDSTSGDTLAYEQTRRSSEDIQLRYLLPAIPGADDSDQAPNE